MSKTQIFGLVYSRNIPEFTAMLSIFQAEDFLTIESDLNRQKVLHTIISAPSDFRKAAFELFIARALECGADLASIMNAGDEYGNTPMHYATEVDIDIFNQMRDFGGNLFTRNEHGKSVIDSILHSGNFETCKLLLSEGQLRAYLQSRDESGHSVLRNYVHREDGYSHATTECLVELIGQLLGKEELHSMLSEQYEGTQTIQDKIIEKVDYSSEISSSESSSASAASAASASASAAAHAEAHELDADFVFALGLSEQ
jgi:ankyrin repeat protein